MAIIRVAFCITELEPGGAERALVELATGLDRSRFAPRVYCLAARPSEASRPMLEQLEQAATSVEFLGGSSVLHAPQVLWKLRAALRRDQPDVLQSFLFHANVLGPLAARLSRVPHVATGIRVAERRAKWHLALMRWVDRWVDAHVCVSHSVADFMREHRFDAGRLVVIPNGIDVERFAAAASGATLARDSHFADLVAKGRRFVTYIGRLDDQKGADLLIDALPELLAATDAHDVLIVGHGPRRASLEARCRRLGVEHRVHFLGWRGDVPAILATSDLAVVPSRWEGMSNVLLEAMAAGKAVVATDVEGVREILGEHASEQIAVASPHGLAKQAAQLLSSDARRTALGIENRRRVLAHFALRKTIESYESLYQRLVERA